MRGAGTVSIVEDGKTVSYDPATGAVTKDGVAVPSYEDNSRMFDPLEKVVAAFLRSFEDEDMKAMFGDHIEVTVNRDGTIETEEHEHD
jgi:hypothetical protein